MKDINNYEGIKEDAQLFYNSIKKVYSSALQNEIHFTDEGFNHIIAKNGKERDRELQISRFRSLSAVVKLLQKSTLYQDYMILLQEFEVKSTGVIKKELVSYWTISGMIEGKKIKVVVRRVGNGKLEFWSAIGKYSC